MGGIELITVAKSGPALRRALGSAPAFAGPAGPCIVYAVLVEYAQFVNVLVDSMQYSSHQ